MSVVNKMLKDLEARETKASQIQSDYQPPQKHTIKTWKIVLAAILIIAFLLFLVFLVSEFLTSTSTVSASQSTVTLGTPKKMALQAPENFTSDADTYIESTNTIKNSEEPLSHVETNKLETNSPIPALKDPQTNIPVTNNVDPGKALVALQHNEKNKKDKPELESSFTMSSSNKENEAVELKAKISEKLANNDINQASKLLHQLIKNEPNNIEARKKLAALYFSQGNDQQASFLLLRSVEKFPENGGFKLMLARLYVAQGKPNNALDLLTAFQPELSEGIEYLGYRAALAQQLNKLKLATQDYQNLTKLEPQNAKWWLGLGITNDKLGNYTFAIQAYRQTSVLGTLDYSVEEFVNSRISVLTEDQ